MFWPWSGLAYALRSKRPFLFSCGYLTPRDLDPNHLCPKPFQTATFASPMSSTCRAARMLYMWNQHQVATFCTLYFHSVLVQRRVLNPLPGSDLSKCPLTQHQACPFHTAYHSRVFILFNVIPRLKLFLST